MNESDTSTSSVAPDETILNAKRDKNVLGRLLEQYQNYLVLTAKYRLGRAVRRRLSAADLVQTTCCRVCERIDQFRGETQDQFFRWLQQTHSRVISDALREHVSANGRSVQREVSPAAAGVGNDFSWFDFPNDDTSPKSAAYRSEMAVLVAAAVGKLPESQQDVLELRLVQGLRIKEIAQELQTTSVAVASLLKRALQSLRREFEGHSWP